MVHKIKHFFYSNNYVLILLSTLNHFIENNDLSSISNLIYQLLVSYLTRKVPLPPTFKCNLIKLLIYSLVPTEIFEGRGSMNVAKS